MSDQPAEEGQSSGEGFTYEELIDDHYNLPDAVVIYNTELWNEEHGEETSK